MRRNNPFINEKIMIYSYAEYLTEVLGKININARQNK
jgi:hypothetical protein